MFKIKYSSLLTSRRSDKVGIASLGNEDSKLRCGQIIPTTVSFVSKQRDSMRLLDE